MLDAAQAAQDAAQAAQDATRDGVEHVSVVSVDSDGTTRIAAVDAAGTTDVVEEMIDDGVDIVAVEAVSQVSAAGAVEPSNDPFRRHQWAFDTVKFEKAWGCGTGAGVTVAVIDTGVDQTHPEFSGRITSGASFLGKGTPAQLGGGGVDPAGHGTHVAGIIAAAANNGVGITGVAPGVEVLPVRVLDDSGDGWDIDVALGIAWAVDQGADIINLSLGGATRSASITTAVKDAVDAGVLVIAAGGNDGAGGPVSYPGAEPGVIAVAASTQHGHIAGFSTTGDYIDITAPGQGIYSTYPDGRYTASSGTSMATPHVVGVAAIIKSAAPHLTASQITDMLLGSAEDRGPAGRDSTWGEGFLNPIGALAN